MQSFQLGCLDTRTSIHVALHRLLIRIHATHPDGAHFHIQISRQRIAPMVAVSCSGFKRFARKRFSVVTARAATHQPHTASAAGDNKCKASANTERIPTTRNSHHHNDTDEPALAAAAERAVTSHHISGVRPCAHKCTLVCMRGVCDGTG